MLIKTSELTGAALDWAVATIEKAGIATYDKSIQRLLNVIGNVYSPSSDWAQGGPIIDRGSISVIRCDDDYGRDSQGFTTGKRIPVWCASIGWKSRDDIYGSQGDYYGQAYSVDVDSIIYGPTPLIAAMRCYVASKLGDSVDVPDELL